MKDKREARCAPSRGAKTVADSVRSVREDDQIEQPTKEQIIGFLSSAAVEGLKLRTVHDYATALRRLAGLCASKAFHRLERADVRQIIFAKQEKGYRTSTMNLFKARFLRFQRWLREEYGYPQRVGQCVVEELWYASVGVGLVDMDHPVVTIFQNVEGVGAVVNAKRKGYVAMLDVLQPLLYREHEGQH